MELDENTNPHMWAKTEYYHGWFSYVTAVWQMVKNRITADAIKRQKEREKAGSKVDVPEKLRNIEEANPKTTERQNR